MSEFSSKSEEMDRRNFVKGVGAVLASLWAVDTGLTFANLFRSIDIEGRSFEAEGKEIPAGQREEVDKIAEESLGNLEKMRENITAMKEELRAAGATDKQLSDSVSRYAKYAGDRLEHKMIEFAEQLEHKS